MSSKLVLFKYKNDSKSTISKAFDDLKSYFSTGEALKDLKDELRKKEEFGNGMDQFISDYEKRRDKNPTTVVINVKNVGKPTSLIIKE